MQVVLMLAGALAMPLGAFGFLLWLAHLEETLPADVRRAQRRPEPPPILAIPMRVAQPEPPTVVIPEQRPAPALVPELSESTAAIAT